MEFGALLVIFIVGCCIFGGIGALLGSTVNKGAAGLFLGVALGPIGWILVLLLPRGIPQSSTQSENRQDFPEEPPCERDLALDAYQIWLVKKYRIQKNEVLGKYIYKERLFATIDDVLVFVDSLERQEGAEREKFLEQEQHRKIMEAAEIDAKYRKKVIILLGLSFLYVIGYIVWDVFLK